MTNSEIKALASEVIGDGQNPNMFFVTHGPYVMTVDEYGDVEHELIDGFPEEATYTSGPYNTYEEAKKAYDDIELDIYEGVGQVFIEDRLTGVITEKFLSKQVRIDYSFLEHDDAKQFGYIK